MIMKGDFYCFVFILLLVSVMPAGAQDELWQDDKVLTRKSSWRTLLNPAGLARVHQQQNYTDFTLDHTWGEGDFQRPQWPSQFRFTNLNVNGLTKIPKMIFAGSFNYQLARNRQQFWRNTHISPEESPFIWADSSAGLWHLNLFSAKVLMANNSSNQINFGLELVYSGGSGDRKNDPRPLFRQQSILIKPGVAFMFLQGSLGLHIAYRRYTEDNEVGFFSVQNSLLYRLRGYGTFSRTPFVSGERIIRSDQAIAGLSYVGSTGWEAEIELGINNGEVVEGIANPNPQGEWYDTRFKLSTQDLTPKNSPVGWRLSYDHFRQSGSDPVFQAINYYLQKHEFWATVRWEPVKNDLIELSAGWHQRRQEDIIAATKADIMHASLKIAALFDGSALRHYPAISWYHPLRQQLNIGNPGEISQALIVPDFNLLKRGFVRTSYRLEAKLLQTSALFLRLEPTWRYNRDFQFLTIYSALIYTIQ
jgi:hypothetical protein